MATRPTILVIAASSDVGARLAAKRAAALAPDAELVVWGSSELARLRWSHSVDPTGHTASTLALGTRRWTDGDLAAVWFLQRTVLEAASVATWSSPDRAYAEAEQEALWVSLLGSLGDRVVNAVDGSCPLGPSWSRLRWLAEARAVSLPIAPTEMSTSAPPHGEAVAAPRALPGVVRRVHGTARIRAAVVGGRVFGTGDPEARAGLSALAAKARCGALEVTLVLRTDGKLALAAAEPLTRLNGAQEIEAAARLLVQKARLHITQVAEGRPS